MPFYLFSLGILETDNYGQQKLRVKEGVRQINITDLDAVWRQYKVIAKNHYGSHNLKHFCVVKISKLDPRAVRFVKAQGKKDEWAKVFEKESGLVEGAKKRKQREGSNLTLAERAKKKA